MKFTEGEEVLARHPKTADFQKGKILSTRGEKYKIKFESGTEFIVPENDIKAERMSRAGARTSTRLGRKSPSRASPSRKSPSRRSPARRSPARSPLARTKKLPTRSTRLAKVSIPRIDAVNDTNVDEKRTSPLKTVTENDDVEPTESVPMQVRLREVKTMTRRSMRLQASVLKPDQDHKLVMLSRNIDRAVSLPIERKSQLYEFPPDKERERGFSVQRDQDVYKIGEDDTKGGQKEAVSLEKRKKEISLVNEPQEWGGWLGASILIFLLPLSVILPQLICSNKRCKSMYIDIPRNWKSYLNLEALLAYFGFLIFLGLASLIPIGRRVDGQQSKTGRLQYRINGFLSAVLSLIILGGCIYKKIPISNFILEKSVQFSISGWIIGTILSIILYVKANKAPVAELNIYASTNSKIYNFWQGREINPRIGYFDFKLLLVRASSIGMILIDAAIIIKCVQESKSYSINDMNLTAILGASLQLFYALDFLIFESHYPTTFGCMYEGTGYMLCIGHLLYPYFYTLMTRVLLYQKTPFSYFTGLAIVGFMASYIIYRWSNWQKATFRNNPLAQSLARLETIPTSRGKKLLTSGWWGMVRHPNYLGDILIQSAIAFIALTTDLLSYYPLLCCVIILMYRAVRDNERCKTRYGYAWEQYCSKVKYMIFKRVF